MSHLASLNDPAEQNLEEKVDKVGSDESGRLVICQKDPAT
jgi:hypothetical protein